MTTITRAIHERWLAGIREEGHEEGLAQARTGERRRLCRQAALRFGAERTARLPGLLDGLAAREDLDRVADWIVECESAKTPRRCSG